LRQSLTFRLARLCGVELYLYLRRALFACS
jgi:hypothetical protein